MTTIAITFFILTVAVTSITAILFLYEAITKIENSVISTLIWIGVVTMPIFLFFFALFSMLDVICRAL